ncbi:uncharacterized protein [Antedon mediterranea]|uniref:uncharacterized protein n=1 Tax=Antedon mediterranea TaxID=105859 RepID=UPI003AF58024
MQFHSNRLNHATIKLHVFLCFCIVYCFDQRGVVMAITSTGNERVKPTEPETEYSTVTTIIVYEEDPTRSNDREMSTETEIGESITAGNSMMEASTTGSTHASLQSHSANYDVSTDNDSQTYKYKQTITTIQMSTIQEELLTTSRSKPVTKIRTSNPDQNNISPEPDPNLSTPNSTQNSVSSDPIQRNLTSRNLSDSDDKSTSSVPESFSYFYTNADDDDQNVRLTTTVKSRSDKGTMFSSTFVFCLIGIVAVLTTMFIIFLVAKLLHLCIKRSKRSKRKHSWKRTKTSISDTYFTIMSGRRPPLPPRNARKIQNEDVESPYQIPVVLLQHTNLNNIRKENLVYQNSEDPTIQIALENYATDDFKLQEAASATIVYKMENIYETAFHNNGFAPDENESESTPPANATDEESRAVKRYISMRCRPDKDLRSSACSEDSAKSEVDGDQLIDNYVNHLMKSDLEPVSPEYNTYDSLPNHYFFKQNSTISDNKLNTFPGNTNMQSSDYKEFKESPEDAQRNNDSLSKNSEITKTEMNSTGGKPTSINELENEYTLEPTETVDNIETTAHSKVFTEKQLLKRGISWSV